MSDYDNTARAVIEYEPAPLLEWLAAKAGLVACFHQWFKDRTIPRPQRPERIADHVALMHEGGDKARPWLMPVECQTTPDADKLDVLHEEGATFRSRARWGPERKGRFDVLTAIVHLTGTVPEEGHGRLTPLGFGLSHKPAAWDIGSEDAAPLLEAVAAGERSWAFLFWVPLMSRGGEAIIAQRWREVADAGITDARRRAELAEAVRVFSELARNWRVWETALEDWKVGESTYLNGVRREAADRAELRTKRSWLLGLLDKRFPGAAPPEVRELIEQQDSVLLLDHWFDKLAVVRDYADFDAELRR